MKGWHTRSRRKVLDRSPFLVVEDHRVELPDGRVIPDWPWVIAPDYVNVVAVTGAGRYLMFRQGKYGVEQPCLAPPGGYLDPGEEPRAAAERELLEETGHRAEVWEHLGSFVADGNRGVGRAHFYLARGARRVAEPVVDDLEEQELLELDRREVEAALDRGEMAVLPWAAVVALALRR